jgi:hypothetical protein
MKSSLTLLFAGIGTVILGACENLAYHPPAPLPSPSTAMVEPAAFSLSIMPEATFRASITAATVASVDLADNLAQITAADVENYHWSQQKITLSLAATRHLLARLAQHTAKAKFCNPNANAYLDVCLERLAFVVTFGEDRLYGGVFKSVATPMVLRVPVIYVSATAPTQLGVFWLRRPFGVGEKEADVLIARLTANKQVHDFFDQLGKLTE